MYEFDEDGNPVEREERMNDLDEMDYLSDLDY